MRQLRVTVVSPHLDDAVLSVGGTIHDLTRRGVDVTVVTIFAGDPIADRPPSYWDAKRGAPTQGVAVRARRDEDEAAAAELGAKSRALPWEDSGYPGRRDPDAIWAELEPFVEEADLTLLPGWPLSHADHRYATLLVIGRLARTAPIAFYAEQPYAAEPITLLKGVLRSRTVEPVRYAYDGRITWRCHRLGPDCRNAQDRALALYAGELRNLGVRARWGRLVRRLSGGEWIGIGERTVVPPGLDLG